MKSIVKRFSGILAFSLVLILTSCTSGYTGETQKEQREHNDFSGIELAISADVYLTQGSNYVVTIEASSQALEKVVTEVRGGNLVIKTERGVNLRTKDGKILVHVTMPRVELLSVSGSGDIESVTPIRSESLQTRVTGSGDIKISELKVSTLDATVSGSGDIRLSGKGQAKNVSARVTGSGDISIKGIEFADGDATVTGSGDIFLHVTENFNARVVGSGDIIYSGNPLIDARTTGSGSIRNK